MSKLDQDGKSISKKTVKKIYFLFFLFFLIQLFLIMHRNSFDIKILFKFYEKNTGHIESLRDNRVIAMSNFFFKNNIKDYKYFKSDFDSDEGIYFLEKFTSYIYPIKFSKKSKNIISIKNLEEKNCKINYQTSTYKLYECK